MPSKRLARLTVLSFSLLLLVLVLLLGSASWFATHMKMPGYVNRTPEQGLHPRDQPPFARQYWMGLYGDPKSEFGLEFADVEFTAVDGSMLRGWFIPSAGEERVGVVTVHGGEGDRRTFMRQLPMLHRAGYPVLMFDYREHGISDGQSRGIAFGWRANHDVSSAVDFLKNERGVERVAVLGTSMGAVGAILAAARSPSIDVVIAENAFTSANDVLGESDFFGNLPIWYRRLVLFFMRVHFDIPDEPNAIDVVHSISPRPLFFLHGTMDESVGVWQSKALFSKAREPKELWVLEGAEHTALYNIDPAEYERRVVGFLNRTLRSQQFEVAR